MITLTAKINLISSDYGTLSGVVSNLSGNNVSSLISLILGVKKQRENPFILGATKLGNGTTFESSVNYFIGSEVSNENGEFETPYEITVNGSGISALTIEFDSLNKKHPNKINIDGVDYADNDSIFTINLESADEHKIIIDNWNAPNYPLVVTGIYVNITIDIDYRNLISLNRNITYRSDNKLPSYGIISNAGNLEFNDISGEIKDYAEQLILTTDLKVEIYLNNTLANVQERIGVFETRDWDYDNDNRSVSVSLKDDLEEWQDIQVEGINYDPRKPFEVIENGSMDNLYKWLQAQDKNGNYRTPLKYQMLSFNELDVKTQEILENTKINYPLLENGTLWQQWEKLCQVCGLYIYKNNEGKTVCSYTYGS